MTDQLRELFHDLADDAGEAPRSLAAPAVRDLWTRGRRARRRRIAGSVLAASAVLAIVGAIPVVGGELSTTPAPATYDERDLAVPDRLWAPSSWLSDADEEHPPGPLSVVARAERRSPGLLSSQEQWFGISAVDQSYHWLDLPEASPDADMIALSPDGRRIGYFTGGAPTLGRPKEDVTGFAVFDTVTGEVSERPVDTKYGLSPESILWSWDGTRLVVGYGQWTGSPGLPPADVRAYSYDVESGTSLPLAKGRVFDGVGPGGVTAWRGPGFQQIDAATGSRRAYPVPRGGPSSISASAEADNVLVNPSQTAVVMLGGQPDLTEGSALHAADLGPDGRVGTPRLLGWRYTPRRIIGWLDDDRVLAEAVMRGTYWAEYVEYDLWDGSVEPYLRVEDEALEPVRGPVLAQDILRLPQAQAEAPPHPWHPWWGWAAAAGGLVVGMVVAAARRNRHRREVRALSGGRLG